MNTIAVFAICWRLTMAAWWLTGAVEAGHDCAETPPV